MKLENLLIIGSSGIGYVHIREFIGQGVFKVYIFNRNFIKAEIEINTLKTEFPGIQFCLLKKIDEIKNLDIDIVSICTPKEFHFKYMEYFENSSQLVFIEKPFFWFNTYIDNSETILKLQNKNKIYCVNTCNSYFIEKYFEIIDFKIKDIKYFEFYFNSHGIFSFDEIGIDLLPHALSMLIKIKKSNKIRDIYKKVNEKYSEYIFTYDGIECKFFVSQDINKDKELYFIINDSKIKRVQEVIEGKYRVFLEIENTRYDVEDPFLVIIQRVASNYKCNKEEAILYEENLLNMYLLNELIFHENKG